jgi:hypothetical protein
VIARDDDGQALGCGALRSLGQPVVEIKRMYVRREAVAQGFQVVRLETGPQQPEAIGLYARAGYREIPCFGAYSAGVASRCFERRLGAARMP